MFHYKLTYFDARQKGELSRLCFAAAGVKFEDERICREDWPTLKPAMPFGQLPVLTVNGTMFAQSGAIEKYLAREFAFYGKTSLEALEVDEILGLVSDYRAAFTRSVHEKDPIAKEQLENKAFKEDLPRFLTLLERKLKNNFRGYFVGDRMSLADLAVYDVLDMTLKSPNLLENYPAILQNRSLIASSQKISVYLKNRK